MTVIPFPAYEPDASPFNIRSAPYIINALPVRDGWGPCPQLKAQTAALASAPKGGASILQANGSYDTFVGTTTHLYRLANGGTTWEDYSDSVTFAVPDGDFWSFHNFGTTPLVTNVTDGLLERSGSVFTAVAGSPPNAKFVNSVGDFVLLMNLDGLPSTLQWSGIGDRTNWVIGENLGDRQTFADGGAICGAVSSEFGAYILQSKKIRRMLVTPDSEYAFRFEVANPTRGCVAPMSIVEAGSTFFYLDEDGFYRGPEGASISADRVNAAFFEDLDEALIYTVQGANDPLNKRVWWRYPKSSGGHAILVYDWHLDRWAKIDANVEFIFGVTSAGFTIDDLDSLSSSIDGIPYPVDSRIYLGGLPLFAGIDTDYKFGYFGGVAYEATLRTAEIGLNGEDRRGFVNGFHIKTDAPGAVSARVGTMDTFDDDVTWSTAREREASTGMVPCRADGRLHQFEVVIPEGTNWTHAHSVKTINVGRGRR